MALLDGRTDSPTALGWQFSPCQTYSCENHKTVIRHATDIRSEAKAKLRKINKPMESGTRPTSSPNRAAMRCRATSSSRFGRTGSLSVFGQKRCAPAQRHHCLSFGPLARARVSRAEATPKDDGVPRVVIPLCEGQEREPDAPDRGYGGPTRPPALISGPSDRWLPLR